MEIDVYLEVVGIYSIDEVQMIKVSNLHLGQTRNELVCMYGVRGDEIGIRKD